MDKSSMLQIRARQWLPLGGAIALAGFTSYIFYKLFLKEDDDENFSKPSLPPPIPVKTKEVKIPSAVIGVVIGRQGANVKSIESITKTIINFKDGEGQKICIIKGRAENVEAAEKLIFKTIGEIAEIETDEVYVPNKSVGRLIGHGGANIQLLQKLTGAKIKVDRKEDQFLENLDKDDLPRKIFIRGTKEQIETAKSSILSKVEEDRQMREKIKASAENMAHRSRSKDTNLNNISNAPNNMKGTFESLVTDSVISAYVSALETPVHFWLQVVGPKTVELENLLLKMTEYYNDPECKDLHTLNKFTPGDIVAAVFPHDSMWYRGRICPHEEQDDPSKVVVYFLDFGDTECIDPENVCELRTDFLRLNFQAIECCLANFDPNSEFKEGAIVAFENLSHAMKFKAIKVKVVEYREIGSSLVPCVKLFNIDTDTDVDIGEELLKQSLTNHPDGSESVESNSNESG